MTLPHSMGQFWIEPFILQRNSEGAFYMMPNVSGLFGKKYEVKVLNNSLDVAAFILEEAHVAVVPGLAF